MFNSVIGRLIRALPAISMAFLAHAAGAWAQSVERSPAASGAKAFFVDLKDGAKIPAQSLIRFDASGIDIVPAGEARPNSGHFHLIVDMPLPALDREIPSDFNHIHLGRGQREVELSLAPGEHTLQLLLGDQKHAPHEPPVFSAVVHVHVEAEAAERARTPAPADAKVFFIDLKDGSKLPVKSVVKFGISGMEVVPAGTEKTNSGHHHLLVDAPLPPLDHEIPSDPNHLHFGRGQTSVELTLAPGEHTLQLLLADHQHVPHDPPVMSNAIKVTVEEGAGAMRKPEADADRQPSPPDAKVYFVYPRDGETIFPNSTIRFGLSNMGVAPAGVKKANTGHHHLIIDAETPALDQPIPNDPNHLHFGAGQTEKKITLSPGPHTLQLILADDRHLPHDPPVISERIHVTVGAKRAARRPAHRDARRARRGYAGN
jgi:hypothetical protein